MADYNWINFSSEEGRADLTLNSLPHNLLSVEMLEEIVDALNGLRDDETLKVLYIRGEGNTFCGGVQAERLTADRIGALMPLYTRMYSYLMSIRGLILAGIEGEALGHGCELAAFCDVAIASESATFGFPNIKLGLFPPIATAILPRMVGRNQALDWIISGRTFSADEAVTGRLITRTMPDEVIKEYMDEYVDQIAKSSAPAIVLAKRVVNESMDEPMLEALRITESTYMLDLMDCIDPHEGLAASIAERVPVWRNR